ncbi:MAG TPA: phosphatidylglycerol lysyltransferase domain-containing protein [Patescibacteria group bacterium]|nr:phosphatidylglycerol lysyltransferase domain-containing protein [Patescibacteria group bacterium]
MLPQFPKTKKLAIGDRLQVEKYTKRFPPYSDHNFTSLWVWDTMGKIKISNLNGNLVVEFSDYQTSEVFYSFIGNKKVAHTIELLLGFSQKNGKTCGLKLIPEHNLTGVNLKKLTSKFEITEDRDNFDHILNISDIALMKGVKLRHKRKLLNGFLKRYEAEAVFEDLRKKSVQKDLLKVYTKWAKMKGETGALNLNETEAIKKLFINARHFNVFTLCVYIKNKLAGFTIYELANPEYAISAFQKADAEFRGIYEFMNHQMALHLREIGCEFVNIEQDLGIEGLRRAKKDYNPTFLRKYVISYKTKPIIPPSFATGKRPKPKRT